MNKTKNEVWKPISEAWYVVVNSDSVVRTLDRWVPTKGNGKRLAKGHILKQRFINSGYMVVYFRKKRETSWQASSSSRGRGILT